jgi:hypothetical protein
MKYWFLNIHIQDGEHEHNSLSVHVTKGNEKFDVDDYLKDFYGNKEDTEVDGDIYYYQGGSIACSLESLQEITKKEYTVLKKFI